MMFLLMCKQFHFSIFWLPPDYNTSVEAGTRKALRNPPFKPKLWAGGGRPYRGRIIINSSDLGLSTVDKICRHALIIMRRFFLGKLISGSFVPKISGLGGAWVLGPKLARYALPQSGLRNYGTFANVFTPFSSPVAMA